MSAAQIGEEHTTMAKNTFCHIEFQVTDLQRAQRFYETLFGWTFRPFGEEMVVFGNGADHLGGLMKTDRPQPGASPSVWIEVDSLDDYTPKAVSAGGRVLSEKSEIPSVGWSATLQDPDGNHVGLVQFAGK